ncbi:hypothetical protein [Halegenticoccus soli]|uniref:hypothetical protein n=1 Tax=Halegenticoccus soli TaxID=1985678 RepID=UPI000C6E5588|nr:hypothetical protein [Halegenticoccus soli]
MSNEFDSDVTPADVAFYGRAQHEAVAGSERAWYGGSEIAIPAERALYGRLRHYRDDGERVVASPRSTVGATA